MKLSLLALVVTTASAFNVPARLRSSRCHLSMKADPDFTIAILGDLHLDPRYMDDHYKGREHFLPIVTTKDGQPKSSACVVSLGDLGESKSVDETKQLFAGTSKCFALAREYLDGYKVPFEVVGGNHDLEGIDEFPTDEANLKEYLKAFDKPTPYFKRLLAEKVLLVGLGSTLFRDAAYTSHEVYIDDAQVKWFKKTIEECKAEDGWRVFVFSHAPPMGSGLRVLQENHVVNGCCWLNHSSKNTGVFIDVSSIVLSLLYRPPCLLAFLTTTMTTSTTPYIA